MSCGNSTAQASVKEALEVIELAELAAGVKDLEDLTERLLSKVANLMGSSSALLYLADPRLLTPRLLFVGFEPADPAAIEELCAEQLELISAQDDCQPLSVGTAASRGLASSFLYPLRSGKHCMGFIGLALHSDATMGLASLSGNVFNLLSKTVDRLLDRVKYERQLKHLNTYLTVSSMLAQPLGLHDLLETILYSCIDAASAEEASVLLLDDSKENFCFYQVEGPSKPILLGATFPADRGVAGSVLETQKSEIVDDVQSDPRFYGKIDSDSGFKTRNMIAVPLTAGNERIGVLEVLNKSGSSRFAEEEQHLLLSIAEEIAFAIRNAKVFEYVVNSYCKQRQGQSSCKGCERPLGSWTPCVKYRQAMV